MLYFISECATFESIEMKKSHISPKLHKLVTLKKRFFFYVVYRFIQKDPRSSSIFLGDYYEGSYIFFNQFIQRFLSTFLVTPKTNFLGISTNAWFFHLISTIWPKFLLDFIIQIRRWNTHKEQSSTYQFCLTKNWGQFCNIHFKSNFSCCIY